MTSNKKFPLRRIYCVNSIVIAAVIGLGAALVYNFYFIPVHRAQCHKNLAIIGLALREYHDAYGSFPPAYVTDGDGNPMHSWRVLLLPFLEEEALYEAYRFEEPWNGPNNAVLFEQCPPIYRCPADYRSREYTTYLAIVGKNTLWPLKKTAKIEFSGPSGRAIAIVESSKIDVIWSEPSDVEVSSLTVRRLGGNHSGGTYVCLGDGFVNWVDQSISDADLRAKVTVREKNEASGDPVR